MVAPNPSSIGDLLISFGEAPRSLPVRFPAGPWDLIKCDPKAGWELWACPPCANWKGFPQYSLHADGWQVYSLGEFRPSDPHRLSQDIEAFHGRCLVFAWEGSSRNWHIWTDRFSTLHAYHAEGVVSTFSPAAAAFTSRRLDWPALGGFFGFGFFPGDRTHFEGLRILRPASHLTLDTRGCVIAQERYWKWQHKPDIKRSYSETVDEFGQIFESVMADVLQEGRLAVPLSGGLDSRSTAAAIHPADSLRARCWSYSYGYSEGSVETRIARQIADARQLPFEAFTIRPYMFENLERILAWTEGFQDVTQARQAFVRDEISSHADHLVAALWGDVWLDDTGLEDYSLDSSDPGRIPAHALKKIQKNGRAWLLDHLVRPQTPGLGPEAGLEDWVRSEMASLEHIVEPDFRVKAFKMDQWSFRWSLAPIRVFQSAVWPRLVFYDTRMADFFCTVPASYLKGRQIQIDYLKKFAPDLARIPWQVYDANLYNYPGFNTWQLPKRLLKKVLRVLSGHKVIQRNWEVQFLQPEGRSELENRLVQPGLRLLEFVAPEEIKIVLDSLYARPDAAVGYTVSMLLSFSTWLKQYG